MNARRKELLAEAMRISDIDERLAAIVRAFILPAFSSSSENGGGIRFTKLRGLMSMEGHPVAKKIIASSFDETSHRFADAIADAIPGADRMSILWRGHFLLGALYYTLITPDRIERLSGDEAAATDHERMMDELVRATVASLNELSSGGQHHRPDPAACRHIRLCTRYQPGRTGIRFRQCRGAGIRLHRHRKLGGM